MKTKEQRENLSKAIDFDLKEVGTLLDDLIEMRRIESKKLHGKMPDYKDYYIHAGAINYYNRQIMLLLAINSTPLETFPLTQEEQ